MNGLLPPSCHSLVCALAVAAVMSPAASAHTIDLRVFTTYPLYLLRL
jgi:hypothetical protein